MQGTQHSCSIRWIPDGFPRAHCTEPFLSHTVLAFILHNKQKQIFSPDKLKSYLCHNTHQCALLGTTAYCFTAAAHPNT